MAQFASQHDSTVITVRKIGFADTTVLVMTGTLDTVPTQIFLRHLTTLDSMIVTALAKPSLYLQDFWERTRDQQTVAARAIAPEEMRKNDGRRLYELLKTKGIIGRCRSIGVYVNGVYYAPPSVAPGSGGVPDENVDEYDAVIYYTDAQMPPEFRRTGAGCGALVLYRRSGR
jgi:hypothetical protein